MAEGLESLEGQVIASQFKILKKLGAGGMGAVFLAEQMEMERKVVVKVLHPEITAMNPTAIERFRREAKAVAQLNHPNIVQVYVFGQAEGGQLYLAMEFIEGRDLSVDLAAGAMAQPRALRILDQICAALVEAHGAGIVHRDLKPENVMLADRHGNPDYVKVLDFGIAKLHDSGGQPSLTQTGTVFGTPRYMSPEQVKGESVDARSDIYALGVLFFEMLTGRHPFVASTTIDYLMKHVSEPVPVPHEVAKDLDLQPRVEAIVMKALQKEPAERYQSVAEMQRDVRLAMRDFSEAARGFPSSPPPAAGAVSKTAASAKALAATPAPSALRTSTHQPDYTPPGSRPGRRRGVHPAVWVVIALVLVGGIVGAAVAVSGSRGGAGAGGAGAGGAGGAGTKVGFMGGGAEDPDEPAEPDRPEAPTEAPTKAAADAGAPEPDEPDEPDQPAEPDDPDDAPAPATSVAEGEPLDGFPLPRDAKRTTSTAAVEIYQTTLPPRDVIGFYKAKLHGKYDVRDIPNGLQVDDIDSPFSYVTLQAMGGSTFNIVLSRNTLAEVNQKPPGKVEPAFGVVFPDDAELVVSSEQAVVARSRKSFAEVCDFYVNDARYGKASGVVVARDATASTPYCTMASTGDAPGVPWQAIAIVDDPTAAGAVMITVAARMN